VTHEEMDILLNNHDRILKGNGEKGMMAKTETMWEWFLQSRGKNTFIMFFKDVLISGGIIAFFLAEIFNK
jgi:hypothetical protein